MLAHQSNLRKGRVSKPFGLYFLTKRALAPLSDVQREDVVEALLRQRECGHLQLHAFVVMPDHWHILASLQHDQGLGPFIHAIAKCASYPSRTRGERFEWQEGFFDHLVREGESVVAIIRYIEANPVRKALAEEPSAWFWSSAHPLRQGMLDRTFLGHERWQE